VNGLDEREFLTIEQASTVSPAANEQIVEDIRNTLISNVVLLE